MAEGPASPGGGSHESGELSPRSLNVREQDRFLPIANISRIMKKGLPANGKMSKDAKETVQECVSEFISFVTSENEWASDKCQREKRKTINGDDLLWAMATLGFEDYIELLKLYLSRYREMEGDTKGSAKGQEGLARRDVMQPDHNAQLAYQGSYLQGLDYGNLQVRRWTQRDDGGSGGDVDGNGRLLKTYICHVPPKKWTMLGDSKKNNSRLLLIKKGLGEKV
ncbi:hypothetical protein L1987_00251 [Smallanthus sonchifolius]|uniref:Uncharacterized protein n=1 Tax=Smallanthus sonchifolius TaxID=185202 RepID=A0ACB9K1Q2_9ASTR|nr:hypothetical protein L1987_00251 [Smallanthus sonchifolius]